MALDPEMQEPTEDGTPSEARPDASGTAPDDASIALLQQIAGQLTALTSQVTEMKSELADVRAENAALSAKTEASKTKRLAYLGGQPPARPKPPEPEQPEAPNPEAEAEQVEESSVEAAPKKGGDNWKQYSKQEFASDFENAMAHVEEVDWNDEQEEGLDVLPDADPFITKEMLSEMEDENPEMMSMIAKFNEVNPSDFDQEDPTASTGASRTPAPQEPKEQGADVSIDEKQSLQAAAPEQPSEEASDQAQEPQSDVPMSDEDVQKLLAEEEENATEVQPEPTAAESEQPAAPEPAAAQPEEPQEEPEPDSDEDVTAAEVHQLLAGVAETAKLAAQEDEVQDLVSETQEAAAAPPIEPLSKEDAEHAEDETVEVGFTAFQAGKDVGDEKSDEAADEALEEPVKPRREVVVPTFEVDPDAVKRVPAHLAIAALAIPVRVDESELVLRVVEPIDRIAFDIIGDATTMKVRPEPAPMEEVLAALRSAYGSDSHPEERQAVAAVAPRKIMKGVEKRSKRALKRVKRR